jgi:hypothetical protein
MAERMKSPGSPSRHDLVDAATLSLLATFAQTVVITLTLLVFIFQFRSQEKAIRESSYQNVIGRYNEYVMSSGSADDMLLAQFLLADNKPSAAELGAIRRIMIAYGIIEEAYGLYKKGWIDKNDWEQWAVWLKTLARHPQFATLHTASTGMFDPDFQAYVSQMIGSGPPGPAN